jgi:hypothetical protein
VLGFEIIKGPTLCDDRVKDLRLTFSDLTRLVSTPLMCRVCVQLRYMRGRNIDEFDETNLNSKATKVPT